MNVISEQHLEQFEQQGYVVVKGLLDGEEPGRSTLGDAFQSERDGGILLNYADEYIPAWLAGKLSLMMPESEQFILKWKLGL